MDTILAVCPSLSSSPTSHTLSGTASQINHFFSDPGLGVCALGSLAREKGPMTISLKPMASLTCPENRSWNDLKKKGRGHWESLYLEWPSEAWGHWCPLSAPGHGQ